MTTIDYETLRQGYLGYRRQYGTQQALAVVGEFISDDEYPSLEGVAEEDREALLAVFHAGTTAEDGDEPAATASGSVMTRASFTATLDAIRERTFKKRGGGTGARARVRLCRAQRLYDHGMNLARVKLLLDGQAKPAPVSALRSADSPAVTDLQIAPAP